MVDFYDVAAGFGDQRRHPGEAAGDVRLLLTRYEGGSRGPVIAAHGLGVSSGVYAVDTLDTSLVEFLVANGYDVWLLDWRASSRLTSAGGDYACADVARSDWPAALAAVREHTGAESVQALGHGAGALTLLEAILAGLDGVRSAVSVGGSLHVVRPGTADLEESLEEASGEVRRAFLWFGTFAAYFVTTVAATTHENLLRAY